MTDQHTPAPLPQSPFMTAAEVLAYTGYKNRETLYSLVACGFPPSISIGPRRSDGRARKAAWVRAEIYQWAQDQIAAERGAHSAGQPA